MRSSIGTALRAALPHVAALAATVALLDLIAYFTLPNAIAWNFHEYRMSQTVVAVKRGYPQLRVVDGWLAPEAFLDDKLSLVRADMDWIKAKLEQQLRQPAERLTCGTGLWSRIKCYSATANVLNAARNALGRPPQAQAVETKDYRGQPVVFSHALEPRYVSGGRLR